MHRQTAFRHQLLDIPQTQGKPQIPTDAGHDHGRLEPALPEQWWPRGFHAATLPDPQLQHARKSRYRRASGLRRWWRDGDGIAQFSKVVKGALGPRDQSALRHNFGIRAAVPNSVVENFPYDAYLIMGDRPSSLLGAKPRTPALASVLAVAVVGRAVTSTP